MNNGEIGLREKGVTGTFMLVPEYLKPSRLEIGQNSRNKLGERLAQYVENPGLLFIRDVVYDDPVKEGSVIMEILDFAPNESLPEGVNPNDIMIESAHIPSRTEEIVRDKQSSIRDRKTVVLESLAQLMDTVTYKKYLEFVEKQADKKVLLVIGHGGRSKATVGEMLGGGVRVDDLVENLDRLISDLSNSDTNSIDEYSCVVVDTCIPGRQKIPQELIDKLGVPVIYPSGAAGVELTNSGETRAVIGLPSIYNRDPNS